ncbi:MAG: sensor histidine kinase [DPANN group archaeon]|nr:sensor histidine kinase [DPANN group archaeon]
MKIHLPNSAFIGNIDPFLRSFDSREPDRLEITANKKWISVHPLVLSMIAALGIGLQPQNIYCERLEARSKHYLERMGLFRMLRISSGIRITEHEPAGRFIPISKITTSEELTRFITEMVPLLHLEPKHAEPLRYIISELARNVLEHADSEKGAIICAQYYKKSNTIRIGIADTGVGIRKTINNAYDAKTDLDAIRLALTPGITGTTRMGGGTEFNVGAGLFFIRSIAEANRDFFMIYSGDAFYKLLKKRQGTRQHLFADPLRNKHSSEEHLPHWQGTVVGIDISLDTNEEFSNLLDLIKDIFVKTIRERKKKTFRRPRFA